MRPPKVRLIVILLALSVAGCRTEAPAASAPQGLPSVQLVTWIEEAPVGIPADPRVQWVGLVRLDPAVARTLAAMQGGGTVGIQLSLNLFKADAKPVTLAVAGAVARDGGDTVLTVRKAGARGEAVLTFGQRLDLILRQPEGDIVMRQWQGDIDLVTQYRPRMPLYCATHREGARVARRVPDRVPPTQALAAGQVPVVDVLVLYTPAVVRNWPCGPCADATRRAQIESHLRIGLEEINEHFSCSQVRMQLAAPRIQLFDYAERGSIEEDMQALTGPGWKQLAQFRADTQADLVALVAWARNGNGLARLYDHILDAGAKDALSIVDASVAVCGMSLSHEIAHNIGAGHHPDDQTGTYLDSVGWYYEVEGGRQVTIMSQVNVGNFERFGRFSNPYVKDNGEPTGNPGLADNAKTLNANREVVAQFLDGTKGTVPVVCPPE